MAAVPIRMANVQCWRLESTQTREDGKRVDKPLSVDRKDLDRIAGKNLCHWLYLRGECKGCRRDHTHPVLTDEQFDALLSLTRRARCWSIGKGKDCVDPKCIYGHNAPS